MSALVSIRGEFAEGPALTRATYDDGPVSPARPDSVERIWRSFCRRLAYGLDFVREHDATVNGLAPIAWALLVALGPRWQGKREAYPGQERLARQTGYSVRSVRGATRALERAGLLITRHEHGADGHEWIVYMPGPTLLTAATAFVARYPDRGARETSGRAPRRAWAPRREPPPGPSGVPDATDARPPVRGLARCPAEGPPPAPATAGAPAPAAGKLSDLSIREKPSSLNHRARPESTNEQESAGVGETDRDVERPTRSTGLVSGSGASTAISAFPTGTSPGSLTTRRLALPPKAQGAVRSHMQTISRGPPTGAGLCLRGRPRRTSNRGRQFSRARALRARLATQAEARRCPAPAHATRDSADEPPRRRAPGVFALAHEPTVRRAPLPCVRESGRDFRRRSSRSALLSTAGRRGRSRRPCPGAWPPRRRARRSNRTRPARPRGGRRRRGADVRGPVGAKTPTGRLGRANFNDRCVP